MIDGAHEGAFATHPLIAERVKTIVSVTGSMALIAPARRDTRPAALRAAESAGPRTATAREPDYLRPRGGLAVRAAERECRARARLLGRQSSTGSG